MGRRSFSRGSSSRRCALVRERGVSVEQASRDLDLHQNMLRKWVKDFASDPGHAFPGQGQTKPEQAEIERLRREVQKLKAERDILKKPPPTSRRTRHDLRVRCEAPGDLAGGFTLRALGVSRSGFYASLSRRPSAVRAVTRC